MKSIEVCLGSACHLRGADKIVQIFMQKMEEYQLNAKLYLKGSFCLGHCSDAVIVQIGNETLKNVTPENANVVFENKILPYLRGENNE